MAENEHYRYPGDQYESQEYFEDMAELCLAKERKSRMITIKKSPTADSRTCDKVTIKRQTLFDSSQQHINDVSRGLACFARYLENAALLHDWDKLADVNWFLRDFRGEMVDANGDPIPGGWLENHYKIHRHHLNHHTGVRVDVNLLDVLEYISDCVMAGMGRSGSVSELKMTPELLKLAFDNTVALLKNQVQVED